MLSVKCPMPVSGGLDEDGRAVWSEYGFERRLNLGVYVLEPTLAERRLGGCPETFPAEGCRLCRHGCERSAIGKTMGGRWDFADAPRCLRGAPAAWRGIKKAARGGRLEIRRG